MGKRSFVMSSQVAERPDFTPARWREVAEGVMRDEEGNLLIANSLLRFGEDAASEIEAARASGKQVKYDDLGMFDTGVDGVYRDGEGNLTLEDSSLKSRNDVAQLLRKAYKDRKKVVYADQQKPKKAKAAPAASATATPANPAPAAAQAVPAPQATATPVPAASAEPVQDAPEFDEPPVLPTASGEMPAVDDLPALPVAPTPAAPKAPTAKKPEMELKWQWKFIAGVWAAMFVLYLIAFVMPTAPLAWIVALAGMALMWWESFHMAPTYGWPAFIVWVIVTPFMVWPSIAFSAKWLLPMHVAPVMLPITWLGTATVIWGILLLMKFVGLSLKR